MDEMRLSVEDVENRIAPIFRPSIAIRQIDLVLPVFVEDGRMDGLRVTNCDRFARTGPYKAQRQSQSEDKADCFHLSPR